MILFIFNIPISLNAQIFNWGGGNFGRQSLQSFFIENDISNLEENKNNRSKLLYPNPAHTYQTIHIPKMKSYFELFIVDLYGKIIQTNKATCPENTIKI